MCGWWCVWQWQHLMPKFDEECLPSAECSWLLHSHTWYARSRHLNRFYAARWQICVLSLTDDVDPAWRTLSTQTCRPICVQHRVSSTQNGTSVPFSKICWDILSICADLLRRCGQLIFPHNNASSIATGRAVLADERQKLQVGEVALNLIMLCGYQDGNVCVVIEELHSASSRMS